MLAKRAMCWGIAAALLLSGCTGGHGSEAHRAQLAALVGTSRAALLHRFGPPSDESTDADQSFLVWDNLELDYVSASAGYFYDHGALYGGHTAQPAAARFDCRTTFVLVHDRATAYNLSGVGCR